MENSSLASKRIGWIDIAKGFAIIFVFFGHTISTPIVFSEFIYLFHMPLFFVLSGYCFSRKSSFKEFVKGKAKSLILPVFTLGLTGSVAVAVAMKIVKDDEIEWLKLLLNPIIQYGNNDLLWYLPTLFVAFIVFYLLSRLLENHPVFLALISFALAFITYFTVKGVNVTLPWHIDTACIALPFLTVGYLFRKYNAAEKLKKFFVPIISFALCAIIGFINIKFFGTIDMHTNCYGNIILFYLGAFAGTAMIVSLSMFIGNNKVLEFCGKNSLIFYALEPVQYFANYLLKFILSISILNYETSIVFSSVVSLFAVIFIVLICSVAAYIINKFLPFLLGKKK